MNANIIDIIGKRKDGGLDLVIVLDKIIDDSPEEQTKLLDKIEKYMVYVDGAEFKKDFPLISKENVSIKLVMSSQPTRDFVEWLHSIKSWVNGNGIKFTPVIKE